MKAIWLFSLHVWLLGTFVMLSPSEAWAQGQTENVQSLQQEIDQLKSEFEVLKQQYGDRLAALEARVSAQGRPVARSLVLKTPTDADPEPLTAVPSPASQAQQPPEQTPLQSTPTASQAVTGGSVSNSKVFNPDIAVIGDFLGAFGSNRVNPDPAMAMHESEASFQAIVDPYARADFFLSFGEEGVDLEEGFLTFPAVPGGFLVRVGKMRAAFGKVNSLHNHVLPWTDRPLVTKNLVAGEDGINDAGLSVARLIPNPWFFLEATAQVFRGDSSDLFKSSKRGDLSYVGHLRGYHDITENTNIDLGFSYSRGHNSAGIVNDIDVGRFKTTLFGGDATIRWKPLQRAVYHSFVGRAEYIRSRRNQPGALQNGEGFYFSGDYQFARRWFIGGRYDRSTHADDASAHDKGGSAVLTYWPSEFSQIRSQYRRTEYAVGQTANELLMQFQFSIGAHGAHPF
jgi:hypothetical protein